MIGIPIALFASNATEWLVHKYVLHGQGRRKRSFWSFHWHEHHKEARAHGMLDPTYERPVLGWHAQGKEALGLLGMGILVLPLFPIAPFFTATSIYASINYYRVHKRAHKDPAWARANVPWHVDHHLGPNQDANWCVTKPWFDILMGTREHYIGTAREERDLRSREARAVRAAERV
jgi:sterol desaturase/sphingolipid hydroxylase (fatty acid hydroxylase superfamily)